jgi:hypothetical protein
MRRSSSTATGTGRPDRRRVARLAAALAGASLAATATVGVIVATAAVPAFPDNLVVFPDRDFISVEGFADHAGETATVEIKRGGTVMGSAKAVVSGTDVAFEVNHPGGVCWGNDTSLKVTRTSVRATSPSSRSPTAPPRTPPSRTRRRPTPSRAARR